MSSISSEASLIVATFQLLAVQDVTNAIHAADIESGDVVTPAGFIEQPQRRFLDADTFTPSVSSGAPAVYERQVGSSPPNETLEIDRYRPKLVERPVQHNCCPSIVPPIPNAVTACHVDASPIEPPWKVLPWTDHYARTSAAFDHVKRHRALSDISVNGPVDRGEVIDILI